MSASSTDLVPVGCEKPAEEAIQVEVIDWRAGRIALRCTPEWARWLGDFSAHCDVPASELIAKSLQVFAETMGFNVRPPARCRRGRVGVVMRPVRADFARCDSPDRFRAWKDGKRR